MVNAYNNYAPSETKIPQTALSFDTDYISEYMKFLKCLHVRFRDQTLKNESIKSKNDKLKREMIT